MGPLEVREVYSVHRLSLSQTPIFLTATFLSLDSRKNHSCIYINSFDMDEGLFGLHESGEDFSFLCSSVFPEFQGLYLVWSGWHWVWKHLSLRSGGLLLHIFLLFLSVECWRKSLWWLRTNACCVLCEQTLNLTSPAHNS